MSSATTPSERPRTAGSYAPAKGRLPSWPLLALLAAHLGGGLFGPDAARAQLASGGWPMQGNDLRHTGQSAYVGPQTERVFWRAETTGFVKGSPIVGPDGTVYLGLVRGLCSIDPTNGFPNWCTQLAGTVRRNAPALGADGTIYIGERANKMWAVDPQGDPRWSFAVGNDGDVNTSPAIGPDGTIYFAGTFGGIVHALSPAGDVIWREPLGFDVSYSSPALAADGTVYVGTSRGLLFALWPNGERRWTANVHGSIRFGAPSIAADGTVYVGCKRGLAAIDPADGAILWQREDLGYVASTPAIANDGTIYVSAKEGFFALDPDGSTRWSLITGERFRSSPTIGADGTIYTAAGKRLLALRPDGSTLWEFAFSRVVLSQPAIGPDGALYIGADGFYAFKDL